MHWPCMRFEGRENFDGIKILQIRAAGHIRQTRGI